MQRIVLIVVGLAFCLPPPISLAQEPTPTPARWRQRKDEMRRVGEESKRISRALEIDDLPTIRASALVIRGIAKRMPEFYDYGMGDPESNTIPSVFETEDVTTFRQAIVLFEAAVMRLAQVAAQEGEVRQATVQLFDHCKKCHDRFLKKPE